MSEQSAKPKKPKCSATHPWRNRKKPVQCALDAGHTGMHCVWINVPNIIEYNWEGDSV